MTTKSWLSDYRRPSFVERPPSGRGEGYALRLCTIAGSICGSQLTRNPQKPIQSDWQGDNKIIASRGFLSAPPYQPASLCWLTVSPSARRVSDRTFESDALSKVKCR